MESMGSDKMGARHKLKANQVGKAKKPGMVNDGGGLYLSTSRTLSQSWIFRYKRHGKTRDIGLGSASDVSLAGARSKAETARAAVQAGTDPKQALRGDTGPITFKTAAAAYIEAHSPAWRNPKHKSQWINTLRTYAEPKVGDLPVDQVDTEAVLSVLTPIWASKTETASRVRMRIENILAWAKAMGYRDGFNPAIWRGHLDKLLPARNKVQERKHFAALPYLDIPALYAELAAKKSMSAKAIQLTALTACRTGEIIGAQWSEIDGDTWVVPKARMKANKAHRVPLSPAALLVLGELDNNSEYLFPALRHGGENATPHMCNIAMLKLLKTMRPGMTVHGLRSSFRDWAAETTEYQNHVVEMALAHTLSNAVEAAYRRGDLFEKRRSLMDDWASYCTGGVR
jgi:integrase